MLDGPDVVSALLSCGVTHVVWLPDSELGRWESAISSCSKLRLIRVCREGEAIAIAAGLMLGGKNPVVMIQCTGFFEAGDAFRNVVYDLKLPLFLIIGMRSWKMRDTTADSCPVFAERILQAWKLDSRARGSEGEQAPYLEPASLLDYFWLGEEDLVGAYQRAQQANQALAALLPEGSP